jgi:hypothetical protein
MHRAIPVVRFHLARATRDRQNLDMRLAKGFQGTLFNPAPPSRTRRRRPSGQFTVTITADAIAAMTHGQIPAERIIVEAVRAARPDVRNIALDLGTIRWTDPKTGRRATFATPAVVRDALLGLAEGIWPEPFRFVLGRGARGTIDQGRRVGLT